MDSKKIIPKSLKLNTAALRKEKSDGREEEERLLGRCALGNDGGT